MLYAFVDESYIEGKVHLVGALVVTPEQLAALDRSLNDLIWKTNKTHPEVSLDHELHGQLLYSRSGEWECLREKVAVAYAIYRNAVSRIASTGSTWFIGGVRRVDRLTSRYVDPWPPHQIALQYVLEAVNEHAQLAGESVTVIADQVPDQAHHEARVQAWQLRGRTPGWKPSDLACIESPFQWEDSRAHRGLQAADLLTYIYLRKRFNAGENPRSRKETVRISDLARPILSVENVWTP